MADPFDSCNPNQTQDIPIALHQAQIANTETKADTVSMIAPGCNPPAPPLGGAGLVLVDSGLEQ